MHVFATSDPAPPDTIARVLVVADWTVDPYGVVAACGRRAAGGHATFALVVPSWLHGLDWVGDPFASRPCAQRQVDAVTRLALAAGLAVESAEVGDPDPTGAIDDARASFAATEILLCVRRMRLGGRPLDLAHRTRRSTGLEVHRVHLRSAATARARRPWSTLVRGGHCIADVAPAA